MGDPVTESADRFGQIDAVFDVLRDPYRRYLCQYVLRTNADVVTCEDFVTHILDRAPESIGSDCNRERVEIELRHTHLPKLAAVGMVEYDQRSGTVRVDRETIAKRLEQARLTIETVHDDRPDR